MEAIFLLVILNCNDMDFWMTIEWDEQCGLLISKVFAILDGLKAGFKQKNYGESISQINVVMTCMGRDLKQRKRFKKSEGVFEYDILLDYYLIKSVELDEKKAIVRKQIIEITAKTFSTYKFEDFDKAAFLADMNGIVNAIEW
jgi:hypothetical protein